MMVTFATDIFDQELDRIFRDNKAFISYRVRSKEYEDELDGKTLQVYGMRYILKTKEEINKGGKQGATYEEVIHSIIRRIGREYTVEQNGDDYIIKPVNDMVRESKLKNFAIVQGRERARAKLLELRQKQRKRDERRRAEEEQTRAEKVANEIIKHQRKRWKPRKRGKGRRKRWTSPKQRLFEELKF